MYGCSDAARRLAPVVLTNRETAWTRAKPLGHQSGKPPVAATAGAEIQCARKDPNKINKKNSFDG